MFPPTALPNKMAARPSRILSVLSCWENSRNAVNCLRFIKVRAGRGSKSAEPKQLRRDQAYCEERNRLAEEQVQDAIRIIREGGVLQNDTVEFYRSRHDSSACSIILCLMRRYQVDVPPPHPGMDKQQAGLCHDCGRRCSHLRFWGRKRDRASRRFVDCMNTLTRAVLAEQENVCSTPDRLPPDMRAWERVCQSVPVMYHTFSF